MLHNIDGLALKLAKIEFSYAVLLLPLSLEYNPLLTENAEYG